MLAFYIAFTAYPPCSQGAVPPGPLRPKGYSPKGGGSPLLLTHPAPSQRSRQRAEHALLLCCRRAQESAPRKGVGAAAKQGKGRVG